jgi:outer membrane protein assembly factor BamB
MKTIGAVLMCACLGLRIARGEDHLIVPPPDRDYKMVDMLLKGAGDKNGDIRVRGAAVNGKIPVPGILSLRDIQGEISVDAAAIKGPWIIPGAANAGVGVGPSAGHVAIEATIADGRITGTWRQGDRRGAVAGTIRTEAEIRKQNAFGTQADWPCWSGPFTSMAAAACDLKLAEDFNAGARLVWRSEDLVPQGPGNSLNYPDLALNSRTNGGGSSLVVAEGKVFVNYYQPSGDRMMDGPVYWKGDPEYKPGKPDEFLAHICKKKGVQVSPYMREKWLVKADDVVVCMDAATGKTLWKNVFAGKSMNQPSHKGGAVNNTPCVGGGKVFAMGPGGVLHGIEIATGKVLWERTGMSAEGVVPWSGARNMCTAPIYAGQTLIMPDHGSTIRGIDPATGKDLWKLEGKGHRFQVPAKWSREGKEYVLSLSESGGRVSLFTVHCIEPPTGKVLWSCDVGKAASKGVTVYGDTMTVMVDLEDTGGGGSVAATTRARCAAYKLTPAKPEPMWEAPCGFVSLHTLPAVNAKYVVLAGVKESRLLDARTGKELAAYVGAGPFNEGHIMLCEDRVLLSLDGSHGHSEMVILGLSPETFGKPLCTWSQPHPQTTSYHNKHMTFPAVEGRLFMRGTDGVYCYDLRSTP